MLPVELATHKPRVVFVNVPLKAELTVPELRLGEKVAGGVVPVPVTVKLVNASTGPTPFCLTT